VCSLRFEFDFNFETLQLAVSSNYDFVKVVDQT